MYLARGSVRVKRENPVREFLQEMGIAVDKNRLVHPLSPYHNYTIKAAYYNMQQIFIAASIKLTRKWAAPKRHALNACRSVSLAFETVYPGVAPPPIVGQAVVSLAAGPLPITGKLQLYEGCKTCARLAGFIVGVIGALRSDQK